MKKSIVLLVLFTMLVCLFNGAITRAYDVDHKTFENYNFMVAKNTTVYELKYKDDAIKGKDAEIKNLYDNKNYETFINESLNAYKVSYAFEKECRTPEKVDISIIFQNAGYSIPYQNMPVYQIDKNRFVFEDGLTNIRKLQTIEKLKETFVNF